MNDKNKEEKYGVKELADVFIYDTAGEFITSVNTTSKIYMDDKFVYVNDALLNLKLLAFMNFKDRDDNLSDFDRALSDNKKRISIKSSKNNSGRYCKLICKSSIREWDTGDDVEITYVIENARLINNFNMRTKGFETANFDIKFQIYPDDEDNSIDIIIGLSQNKKIKILYSISTPARKYMW